MADRYGPPPLELDPARQRRKTRVVVRSPDPARRKRPWTALPPHVPDDRRRPTPTLIGLGEPDRRTLPDFPLQCESPDYPGKSSPRLSRPVVLREGIDDALAEAYRVEAARILASGVFPLPRQPRSDRELGDIAV
jgi:hypothetical protein